VDLLAKSFNGGGHACAAGFNVDSSIEEFYPKLIRTIGEHLQIVGEGRI
jgi:phosphoesterase RecJ-like protein